MRSLEILSKLGIALNIKMASVHARIVVFGTKLMQTTAVRVAAVVAVELMVDVDVAVVLPVALVAVELMVDVDVVMVLPVAPVVDVAVAMVSLASYAGVSRTHTRGARSFGGGSKMDFPSARMMAARMMAATRLMTHLKETWPSCLESTSCMVSTMLPCAADLQRWTAPFEGEPLA